MKHKIDWGPGYRYFFCEECKVEWKEKSRDCTSFSGEACLRCYEHCVPFKSEQHYEWHTDKHGNLEDKE